MLHLSTNTIIPIHLKCCENVFIILVILCMGGKQEINVQKPHFLKIETVLGSELNALYFSFFGFLDDFLLILTIID